MTTFKFLINYLIFCTAINSYMKRKKNEFTLGLGLQYIFHCFSELAM